MFWSNYLAKKKKNDHAVSLLCFSSSSHTIPSSNAILPFYHKQLAGLNTHCWPCSQSEPPVCRASHCHGTWCLEQFLTLTEDEASQHFCICRSSWYDPGCWRELHLHLSQTILVNCISTLYYGDKTFWPELHSSLNVNMCCCYGPSLYYGKS